MIILTSKLNNSEMASVGDSVNDLWNRRMIESDSYLTAQMDEAGSMTNSIITRLNSKRDQAAATEMDFFRDGDTRALYYEIIAKTHYRDGSVRDSAILLKEVIDRYGWELIGRSYTDQTTYTMALISDLRAEELKPHVDNITEVDMLIDNLQESNNNVKSRMVEQRGLKKDSYDDKSAYILKRELRILFNKVIVPHVSVMAKSNPEVYKAFYDDLYGIIDDMNLRVKDRLLRRKDS